jgi:urea transport system permease protein
MDLLYDTLFNGLAIGSVLVLAALGLAVVFGLMGVINMAHGELMMIGAYTTYVVQNIFKTGPLQSLFPIYILIAIPAAFLVSGLAGVA